MATTQKSFAKGTFLPCLIQNRYSGCFEYIAPVCILCNAKNIVGIEKGSDVLLQNVFDLGLSWIWHSPIATECVVAYTQMAVSVLHAHAVKWDLDNGILTSEYA